MTARIEASWSRKLCWSRALLLAALMLSVAAQPVAADTALVWSSGGLSAGNDSAGNSSHAVVDAAGNLVVLSAPANASQLAITSFTPDGVQRWRTLVAPSSNTFLGGWLSAAPNADVVAVGRNVNSSGNLQGFALVRIGADGTVKWRVNSTSTVLRLGRSIVDSSNNTYFVVNAELRKYDPSGTLQWTAMAPHLEPNALELSPEGADVVSVGATARWDVGVFDAATGAARWIVSANEGLGALAAVVTADRVFVAGIGTVGTLQVPTVIAYVRSTGARLWRLDLSSSTNGAPIRMVLAPNGNLVLTGTSSPGGSRDWYTAAVTQAGALVWQAARNQATGQDEVPGSLIVLADGTTVVAGSGGPLLSSPTGLSFLQGVMAGYGPTGAPLWEALVRLPSVGVASLSNGLVCSTGGYDAFTNCFRVSAGPVPNQPPAARLTFSPQFGPAPLAVTFDGSTSSDSDGTIASYNWSFGDGTSGMGASVSHTYNTVGTYAVTLTVTDNAGAQGVANANVSVTTGNPSVPRAPTGLVATVSTGTNVGLRWNPVSDAASIRVERCRGASCSNFAQVISLPGSATTWNDSSTRSRNTYRYRVRASNAAGNSPYSNIATVSVR